MYASIATTIAWPDQRIADETSSTIAIGTRRCAASRRGSFRGASSPSGNVGSSRLAEPTTNVMSRVPDVAAERSCPAPRKSAAAPVTGDTVPAKHRHQMTHGNDASALSKTVLLTT
ncbi:hypothetical protein [Pararobbsia alpina]|nr:hypothetical protein [Pararobbsia alpina]